MTLSLKRRARYQPRGPRTGVNLATALVLGDDRLVPATIENLSPNGFMAACDRALSENSWLGVELPGCGIVRARVRWNEEGEVGCQFRRPIDPEQVQKAIEAEAPAPELFAGQAGKRQRRTPLQSA